MRALINSIRLQTIFNFKPAFENFFLKLLYANYEGGRKINCVSKSYMSLLLLILEVQCLLFASVSRGKCKTTTRFEIAVGKIL